MAFYKEVEAHFIYEEILQILDLEKKKPK